MRMSISIWQRNATSETGSGERETPFKSAKGILSRSKALQMVTVSRKRSDVRSRLSARFWCRRSRIGFGRQLLTPRKVIRSSRYSARPLRSSQTIALRQSLSENSPSRADTTDAGSWKDAITASFKRNLRFAVVISTLASRIVTLDLVAIHFGFALAASWRQMAKKHYDGPYFFVTQCSLGTRHA